MAAGVTLAGLRPLWVAPWLVLAAACGDPRSSRVRPTGPGPAQALSAREFGILGGLEAPSPELDHTGALVLIDPALGVSNVQCTATLIGPETAVTAKHCVQLLGLFESFGQRAVWSQGGDVQSPTQLTRVVAVESVEPGEEAGALGNGRDVAVVHLGEPVAIEPAQVKSFRAEQLGTAMVTLGFGSAAARAAPDGVRRIGRETVVAAEGLLYEILYGGFETFLEVELTGRVSDRDYLQVVARDPSLVDLGALREQYDGTSLITEYEVVTRTLEGNTRNCRGDSGGPLAQVGTQGEWEIYGVLSGGPSSFRAECDFGQVYATFGPATLSFLERARGWVDPCGDVDERGSCAGAILQRCETDIGSNVRRLVDEDCAASGQSCVVLGDTARCSGAAL